MPKADMQNKINRMLFLILRNSGLWFLASMLADVRMPLNISEMLLTYSICFSAFKSFYFISININKISKSGLKIWAVFITIFTHFGSIYLIEVRSISTIVSPISCRQQCFQHTVSLLRRCYKLRHCKWIQTRLVIINSTGQLSPHAHFFSLFSHFLGNCRIGFFIFDLELGF